jgi:ABC-type bacteriocin/lantibiotic exporter with double-glycine peptidase domain
MASGFISFIYILYRFLGQMSSLSFGLSSFAAGYPHLKSLFEWWHREISLLKVRESSTQSLPFPELRIGWRLRNVSFRYADEASPAFPDLSLEIAPGSLVVLSGRSGSGKSTLLSLLLGEIRPESGQLEVLLEEKSLSMEECRSRLLASVGYVSSESLLFDGSIRENLLYGMKRAVAPEAIKNALELADCGFVRDLDRGLLHTLSEDGSGLSTGQKQRICLARAFLRNPKVLILDEVSANLDQETEENLIATLSRLKGNATIVVATHRESFLPLADLHIDLSIGSPRILSRPIN